MTLIANVAIAVVSVRMNHKNVVITIILLAIWILVQDASARVYYVDDDAKGLNNGLNWKNALLFLQDAFVRAGSGDEIRVAEGTYWPDRTGESPEGTGDREATFRLKPGVTVRGGYRGGVGIQADVRDINKTQSILSGDIGERTVRTDNCFTVVLAAPDDMPAKVYLSTKLEGLKIIDGYAGDERIESSRGCRGAGLFARGCRSIIRQCVFENHYAREDGAAAYLEDSQVQFIDCRFRNNLANSGGAIKARNGLSTMESCLFERNTATHGGAIDIQIATEDELYIVGNTFYGNQAKLSGGAALVSDSSILFINCIFSGNRAGVNGGAVAFHQMNPNSGRHRLALFNSTFSGNEALSTGGAVGSYYNNQIVGFQYGDNSQIDIWNSILWGNKSPNGSEVYTCCHEKIDLNMSYCIDEPGGWNDDAFLGMKVLGTNNISADPCFADQDGADNTVGTQDDNLRVLKKSPAIDAGDSDVYQGTLTKDVTGSIRIVGRSIDIGAFEGPEEKPSIMVNVDTLTVDEGSTALFAVTLRESPPKLTTVYITPNVEMKHFAIIDPCDHVLEFNETNYNMPQAVLIQALPDQDHIDDRITLNIESPGFISASLEVVAKDDAIVSRVLYVDNRAQGTQSGLDWLNALDDLQSALTLACHQPDVAEIRVAQGIYLPTKNREDRKVTFRLTSGLALRGGYAGIGALDPNERNIQQYTTILSGDLYNDDVMLLPLTNADDAVHFGQRTDNSYHVVTCMNGDRTAILDGFHIRGGYAGDLYPGSDEGGGIYISEGASPTIINCVASDNIAYHGAGMAVRGSAFITNSKFYGNVALLHGGGIFSEGWGPTLVNCCIYGNRADSGGGLYRAKLSHFSESQVADKLMLANCLLANNKARMGGGGRFYSAGSQLVNCILWGNDDDFGSGQISCGSMESVATKISISYCDVEGGLRGIHTEVGSAVDWGSGNIERNPLFMNERGLDHIVGTKDDDYRLKRNSPCVDAGNNNVDLRINPNAGERIFNTQYSLVVEPLLGLDVALQVRLVDIVEKSDTGVGNKSVIDIGPYECGSRTIQKILYADSNATGANTGGSWQDAYPDIQRALRTASMAGGLVNEIHVASGTYRPSRRKYDQTATFQLINGVTLYGGFPKGGGRLEQRDPTIHKTILSGDIELNDIVKGLSLEQIGDNCYHVVTGSNTDETAVLDGFIIRAGNARGKGKGESEGAGFYVEYGNPVLRNCTFTQNIATEKGSAILSLDSSPTFHDCVIDYHYGNDIYAKESSIVLLGTVNLGMGELICEDVVLEGKGTLLISDKASLSLNDLTLRCQIQGPGTVHVDLDRELVVEANAVINLDGESASNGLVDCQGLLHIREQAKLLQAEVTVHQANFEDDAIVANCVINAEAGAPYSQFFVEDQVGLSLSQVWAGGDRYLDLNPQTMDVNGISIDAINVEITEGIRGTQGGLFECRGQDLQLPGTRAEFLCEVEGYIPLFTPATWTIDTLYLAKGAKLNLTNRFDFHAPYDSGGSDEVLHVKDLILGPESVFNTAFNQVYYENLFMHPSAEVVNIPLLGFSLNNISFDDEIEYSTRVLHNGTDNASIGIERLVGQGLDPNGLLEMCILLNSQSSEHISTVRAKALFAKSSEPEILIRFEYLWRCAPVGAELIVYLTDTPELLGKHDPARQIHYIEVARLLPPPADYPGAVDSGEWGVFHRLVSKGSLDFVRGTRVEFELRGPAGTCLWINNWDPGIRCLSYCGDVAGARDQVSAIDFLAALSECGHGIDSIDSLTGSANTCLEGFFCNDGVVTHHDAQAVEFNINKLCECRSSLIPEGVPSDDTTEPDPAFGPPLPTQALVEDAVQDIPTGLLILGKRYQAGEFLKEGIFAYEPGAARVATVQDLPAELNTKLTRDAAGDLHVLNLRAGLVRVDTPASAVVRPRILTHGSDRVYIGYHELSDNKFSSPLLDAAFDRAGHVYVVPVTVQPAQGAAYQAAAKLSLGHHGHYSLETLYPVRISGVIVEGLRELALSDDRLFVVNVDLLRKNDSLWGFDLHTGDCLGHVRLSDGKNGIPAPQGLYLAESSEVLYLSSALHRPDALSTTVYGLSVDQLLGCFSDAHKSPLPIVREITITGLGHVTSMTEDSVTGHLWVVGFTIPTIPGVDVFMSSEQTQEIPFYLPCLAEIAPGNSTPTIEARILSDYGQGVTYDLSLPLSATW